MLSYLKGVIAYKKEDYFVIEVNGIGFAINCAAPMMTQIPPAGEKATIYTYMVVREDMMALYGFPTPDELSVFEMLLKVSGIGPKLAGTISGSLEPSIFAMAVVSADIPLLRSVKGVGKKGAEKIIIELKDRIKGCSFEPSINNFNVNANDYKADNKDSKYHEACSALGVLGYSSSDASKVVSAIYKPEETLENIIKAALKELI